MAEVRGLLGIGVLEKGEELLCWLEQGSSSAVQGRPIVPIVQMGRLRHQEAPTQEAGSPFIPGGPGECGMCRHFRRGGRAGLGWGILRVPVPKAPISALMLSRTFSELKTVFVLGLGMSCCVALGP